MTKLNCELALDFKTKLAGLMHREMLPDGDGMIFVYKYNWFRSFWMKGMKFPIDIIFIDADCRITKIVSAPVYKGFFHWKKYNGWAKYVIETNRFWCKINDINVGDKITLGEEITENGISKIEILFLKVSYVDLPEV